MWWLWARVVAAGALGAAPGPRGADAQLAASHASHADTASLAPGPREEHVPSRTNADPPPPPPGPAVVLLDEDVVRALEVRQPSFMRCYRIAQKNDIMLGQVRVSLHVKVGLAGTVDDATADGGPPGLDDCIVAVAKRLTFGPPEAPVESTLNLFFAPS
jgi:hypothetical protein